MKMRICLLTALLVLLFGTTSVGLCQQAGAANDEVCLRYACFSRELQLDPTGPLQLVSATRYRFWGFSVYSVALYQPGGLVQNWQAKPLVLMLSYHRTLKPEDFLKTSRKLLGENPAYASKNDESSLLKFSSFIKPVGDGDRYALVYDPDIGSLELLFNGISQGKIQDKDFAIAYLGMWIGKYAVKSDNRDFLLSGQFKG